LVVPEIAGNVISKDIKMKRQFAFFAGGFVVVAAVIIALVSIFSASGKAAHLSPPTTQSAAAPKKWWHCGMHPQVIQDHPGNCPICHMPLTPMKSTDSGDAKGDVPLWWDPMLGPASISNHPGKSAMGMDMVPYAGHAAGGPEVTIDPAVVQNMGVQTAIVARGPLHKTIRTVGVFKLPEPGLHDISLKVGGWIDTLYADQEGKHVHLGEPLFAVYSQELQVAEQELISAVQSQRSLGTDPSPQLRKQAENMIVSARRKLELWDVDRQEIDAIAKADRAPRDVVFHSPATGHVEDKMIVQGSAIQPGMKLMRIADHTKMWLDAEVYEEQIPLVKMDQGVEATLDAIPGKTFAGTVTFIYPHVDHMTRTLMVRATFDSPDFELKPGMYADVNVITEPVPDAVQVPREAVIDTGTKQIVFVAEGDGHFSPRPVRMGIRGDDDRLQIVEGLAVGETVVTSGQFLMDVESRTNEAIAKLRGGLATAAPSASTPAATSSQPTTQPRPMPPMSMPSSAGSQSSAHAMAMESPAGMGLSVIHCPMARADWVQQPGETSNPYMEPAMRQCGTVTAQVGAPEKDSPLSRVMTAYLTYEKALVGGSADAMAAEQLKAAASQLQGDAYTKLREAIDKLAGIKRLEPAREQFKAVSAAIIPILKQAKGS